MEFGPDSILDWALSEAFGKADFEPSEQRYRVEAPIGSGGMGEVFLVTDQDLRRQIAMKLMREELAASRDPRLHFIAEAQATSQLEHPGIPPVHDIGIADDGRLYFTMKLVQGRTLREVLQDLLLKRREVHQEYRLHRLISILERVCETLHFAHEKGVVHRDLKPENIMLGDYGEVHVMDWGLARIGEISDDLSEIGAVETARRDADAHTHAGAVKGTLAYMSPEQYRGDIVDRRSDVYATGCLLYEILTLQKPFDSKDAEFGTKKQAGDVVPVRDRNPRRSVPEPLAALCEKAMERRPEDRFETARELAAGLRRWLDGRSERERQRLEASRLAASGGGFVQRYVELVDEIAGAKATADAEARKYKPHQPVAEKRPMIEARERVKSLELEATQTFAQATHLLEAALTQDEENEDARTALIRLWRMRLDAAERAGDSSRAAYSLWVMQRYSREPIRETGALSLDSEPAGAEVLLYHLAERDGVLTPVGERSLGATPLGPIELSAGSYLCILKAKGYRDTRYPVLIERERTWAGSAVLRTDEAIGDGFVLVPAGPFTSGDGQRTTIRSLPDFAIQKYPVTFAEYIEFLDSLDEAEARERLPRTPGDGPYLGRDDLGRWSMLPTVEGPAREWSEKRYGEKFELRTPVVGVAYEDAEAYCAWKSATTRETWRLPTAEEREKAARGVDGRLFAWGDLEDASLGKCRESRSVPAQPEPVGAFPTAASVYDMGDASGGVWDWTSSWADDRRAWRSLLGGSWFSPTTFLRCSERRTYAPRVRRGDVGFRCARSL